MMRKRNAVTSLTVMAGIIGLTITGCANPIETLVNKGAEKALEKVAETQGGNVDLDLNEGGLTITGEDGETYDIGATASVPDTWPDLPLPSGDVISAIAQGDSHALMFASTRAELETLISALRSSGFEETGSLDMGELTLLMFSNGIFNINVGGIADGDGDKVTIQYQVTAIQ